VNCEAYEVTHEAYEVYEAVDVPKLAYDGAWASVTAVVSAVVSAVVLVVPHYDV
jgi:hypothetical protein